MDSMYEGDTVSCGRDWKSLFPDCDRGVTVYQPECRFKQFFAHARSVTLRR